MLPQLRLFVFALLALPCLGFAQDFVPDALDDWQQWVLKDREYRDCPFYFDRGAAQPGDFLCIWPGRLQLDATATGATFTQHWTVDAKAQWVALPGGPQHWPDRVTANGSDVEVVARNNVPSIRLAPGSWRVTGRFAWDERPGVLRIPPESGLLTLSVDGDTIERPELNRNGVFLGERRTDTRAVDSVRTVVYRLVADEVPTRLITQLQIDVSGSVREEQFGPILPDGFVPMSLRSQLPAKLEADGRLHLQVRPGRWTIFIAARGPAVLNDIVAPSGAANLPDTEIWSYQSNDRLRVTAAEGLPPVDPMQVEVPRNWQSFPAFRVGSGDTFSTSERSRGIVSASNELFLERLMWLDFDGDGFVVLDTINGQMRADWRLDMAGPYTLLAATEYDESLLITNGRDEGETGVEVRQTDVSLETLGRSDTRTAMPVSGWDSRFAGVKTNLNLPPGHKLLAAPGVDTAYGSWTWQWQLLDFFLVLIITIAVWRLFSPAAGVVALFALVLSFHELFAPTWLWLNLLVAVALLRVTPAGRLFNLVRSYQLLSAAALVIVLVPFVAGQLRVAIYPQLEPQYGRYALSAVMPDESDMMYEAEPAGMDGERVRQADNKVARTLAAPAADSVEEIMVTASKAREQFSRYAPNAIVQAGQGIPSWRWNRYRLEWSGPVDADQTMRLVVLPRWLVSALRFIEVGLMLLFAAIIAAEIAGKRWKLPGGFALGRSAVSAGVAVIAAGLLLSSPAANAQLPDNDLLQQLEQRLLEPPDCVPRCAEIASATVDVGPGVVEMRLSIHALEDVAIPLPGSATGWRATAVLVDGSSGAHVIRAANGALWLRVSPGLHSVTLRGTAPAADTLEIPFPTPPRVVSVESDGWMVAGIKDRRLLSGSLQLSRLQSEDGGDAVRWESSRFPAFARVERDIELDLDWRLRTTVYRVAPLQGALTLEVPLVEGESIVSGDFTVEDGRVLVTMSQQQHSVSWTSNLVQQSPTTLQAPVGAPWKELWRVAVGNIWNASFDGVPESNAGNGASDVRVAEFDPRAGESLVITAARPEASAGSTLAFDSVDLDISHGNRSSDVEMRLDYRSTRGAQHVVQLPMDAEVTSVRADGRELTLRADDNALSLPILPGEHTVAIAWRAPGGMGFRSISPEVDLGAPASNIEVSMQRPQDRWLLATSGPQLGPAVLYWTEFAVMILFAVILGRIGLAPLATWQWLVLGLGFSTFSWPALGFVVAWLLVCGARDKLGVGELNWWRFNVVQVVIGGLTVAALMSIISALPQGLLGAPDMHVTGHNSHAGVLSWFADRSDSALPLVSALTVPMWVYKAVILAWALWLSFALVRWLPWVWKCFSGDGFWRKRGEEPAA